jgi:hypothetical protein
MAVITNYATLQTAVADYLARDDLTSFIPNFVQNAENKIYRRVFVRAEETALNVSISSGVAAVPADFKRMKFAYFDGTPVTRLVWVPIDKLYEEYPNRSSQTTPKLISREGSNFVFGPVAKDGTLKGIYYQKLDPIRTTDDTWYVTDAPEVLLYGSLMEAAPFLQNDERIPAWKLMLEDGIQSLKEEVMLAEHSAGPKAARPG